MNDDFPKRPWQGPETRLGIKWFGREMEEREQDKAGLGWVLMRLRSKMIDEGVEPVGRKEPEIDVELTGAEYRCLLEDCTFSIAEAADFHQASKRSIEHWQKSGPPVGAAGELVMLRAEIEQAALDAVDLCQRQLAKNHEIDGVDLYRYHSQDYELTMQWDEGLPHAAHNRIIALTADKLAAVGIHASIEYWQSS